MRTLCLRNCCRLLIAGSVAVVALGPSALRAQAVGETARQSEAARLDSLAKLAQNPIGNLISIPFQDNASYGYGPYNRDQNTLNIQPVIPFSVGSDWNIITRTIFPLVWLPVGPSGSVSGLSNVNFSAYLSPAGHAPVIWGVGPTINFASTSPTLGSRQYSAGPALVLVSQPGRWVFGLVANNTWGFAGPTGGAPNWNQFYSQVFVNYNFKHPSFYLTFAPIITANWNASPANVWTVPLGAGVGKLIKLGKLPVNCNVSAYSYVARPEGAPDWTLRLLASILLPKSILSGKE